jgi:hypothetical protein
MEGDRMENEEQEEERRESPKGKRAWQKAELEYVERRQAGESIQALSDSLYVAESLCLEWEQAHKKEIEQSRFLQTGNLLREKGLTRVNRIETMSKILDKINSEIDRRDFSDIPTDKLIILGVKLQEFMKVEIQSSSIEIDKPYSLEINSKEKMFLE